MGDSDCIRKWKKILCLNLVSDQLTSKVAKNARNLTLNLYCARTDSWRQKSIIGWYFRDILEVCYRK